MKPASRFLVGLIASLACASLADAQTSFPMVKGLRPMAAQIGQTSELELDSQFSLDGAYQVFVDAPGVTAEVIAPPAPQPAPVVAMAAKPDEKPAEKKEPEAKKPEADKKPDEKKADEKKPEDKRGDEKKPDAEKKPEPKDQPAAEKKPEPAKAAETAPAPKPDITKLKIRVTVPADALPGAYDFRVVTPRGPSTLGQIVLVRDPVFSESGGNDTLDRAQTVQLPATICGSIEKEEDVDFFKFHVEAGTGLTFQVYSCRAVDRLTNVGSLRPDPIIKIRNATGTVLAMADNYYSADPLLHYQFATAGDYYLEVRDVRYAGNATWLYSVAVNDRPYVTNVFPMAIAPGKATTVEMVGFNLPADPHVTLTLPADAAEGPQRVLLPLDRPANPAPVVASRLPEALPSAENHEPAKAQEITLPCGVNGRIAAPGQIDYYGFTAKKGDRFSFEVIARRLDSALDPLVAILNEKGARVVESDDTSVARRSLSADSLLENWTAPADGRYVLEVRDVHLRGGAEFVYYLKAAPSEPFFLLDLDTDKTPVPPGMASPLFVRIQRHNGFTGEVKLTVTGLPPGITATCGRILDGAEDGCVLLQAAPGASLAAGNIRVEGTSTFTADGREYNLSAVAAPFEEIHAGGGGRVYFPARMHTVSVCAPMDLLSIQVEPTNIELKPGGSQKITVKIERAPSFSENVTLDAMMRHLGTIYGNSLPAGVTVDEKASKTLLSGKLSEGNIVLKAAADAKPVEKQLIPVMGSVAITFALKVNYAGPPVYVSIVKP